MGRLPALLNIDPGVIEVKAAISVSEDDRLAGKVIEFIISQRPDATFGEAADILSSAQWWLTLWASESKAEKLMIKAVENGNQD